jgi:hypothetical protein
VAETHLSETPSQRFGRRRVQVVEDRSAPQARIHSFQLSSVTDDLGAVVLR